MESADTQTDRNLDAGIKVDGGWFEAESSQSLQLLSGERARYTFLGNSTTNR